MGIEVVLTSAKQHCTHAEVQMAVCDAVANLATANPGNLDKIAMLGGIEAVLDSAKKHSSNAGVREAARRALTKLSDNLENRARIVTLSIEAVTGSPFAAQFAHGCSSGRSDASCGKYQQSCFGVLC